MAYELNPTVEMETQDPCKSEAQAADVPKADDCQAAPALPEDAPHGCEAEDGCRVMIPSIHPPKQRMPRKLRTPLRLRISLKERMPLKLRMPLRPMLLWLIPWRSLGLIVGLTVGVVV